MENVITANPFEGFAQVDESSAPEGSVPFSELWNKAQTISCGERLSETGDTRFFWVRLTSNGKSAIFSSGSKTTPRLIKLKRTVPAENWKTVLMGIIKGNAQAINGKNADGEARNYFFIPGSGDITIAAADKQIADLSGEFSFEDALATA